jgi:hypothetical protein
MSQQYLIVCVCVCVCVRVCVCVCARAQLCAHNRAGQDSVPVHDLECVDAQSDSVHLQQGTHNVCLHINKQCAGHLQYAPIQLERCA